MAHMHKHYSLVVAEAVLRAANSIGFSPLAARRLSAGAWDGCREQGLCLNGLLLKDKEIRHVAVFIAQHRSSDGVIVVVDENKTTPDNQPSPEAWEKGVKHFRCGEAGKAARYVVDSVERLVKQFHVETEG